MSVSNQRFQALDAFRGIFASMIIIFHLHVSLGFSELSFFRNSYLFVEFFFVLSGFVMAHGYGFKQNLKFKSWSAGLITK